MYKEIVDGIHYTSKYITDQELAVIESMRQGAYVNVTFHNSEMDRALFHLQSTPLEVFNKRRITYFTDSTQNPFICLGMGTSDRKVEINHYVDVSREGEVIQ